MKKHEAESLIERKLSKGMKEIGGWAIKLLPFIIAGLPDRLVLYKGRAYFVELKATGKRCRPDQVVIHNKLARFGFSVYVIDSSKEVENFLNEIE